MRSANANFGTKGAFVCLECKKLTRATGSKDNENVELCKACYEANLLANEHADGGHDDVKNPGCPSCGAVVNQDAVSFVKHGYGDLHGLNTRSLDFKTESFDNFETCAEALKLVESYNNFNGPRTAKYLAEFWSQLMSVQFGREGSPVLYLKVPYWTHQAQGWDSPGKSGVRLTDDERMDLTMDLLRVGKLLEADEAHVDPLTGAVRLWWD